MPNDWQPTTPDTLPWGEVVEVRWPDGSIKECRAQMEAEGAFWYHDYLQLTQGTKWRRLERGERLKAMITEAKTEHAAGDTIDTDVALRYANRFMKDKLETDSTNTKQFYAGIDWGHSEPMVIFELWQKPTEQHPQGVHAISTGGQKWEMIGTCENVTMDKLTVGFTPNPQVERQRLRSAVCDAAMADYKANTYTTLAHLHIAIEKLIAFEAAQEPK